MTSRYQKYYRENKEWLNELKWDRRTDDPVRFILQAAKARAKKYGIKFTITRADLPADMPKKCPWLRIPLVPAQGRGGKSNSPSLDRLDSKLGYVPGNVIIISKLANSIKTNATADEILKVGRGLKRALKERVT